MLGFCPSVCTKHRRCCDIAFLCAGEKWVEYRRQNLVVARNFLDVCVICLYTSGGAVICSLYINRICVCANICLAKLAFPGFYWSYDGQPQSTAMTLLVFNESVATSLCVAMSPSGRGAFFKCWVWRTEVRAELVRKKCMYFEVVLN